MEKSVHLYCRAELVLDIGGASGNVVIVSKLSDLDDYCKPHAAGALLKAAFICAEVVDYPSSTSLKDQLITKYGGGFELHTWSNLPHGSGRYNLGRTLLPVYLECINVEIHDTFS